MSWVAILPLRAGSKSIPGKNRKPIAGRPLFAWSLGAALDSGCFDEVWVSTDDTEIRDAVGREFGGDVRLIDRPAALATDVASTDAVLLDFRARVPFEVLCLVQATSPLTRADDFREAKRRFLAEGFDSLLTAVETNRFFWTRDGRSLSYVPAERPRRQDHEGLLMENGAFYFTKSRVLEESSARLGGRIGVHLMPAETAIEIDEPLDWFLAEQLLLRRRRAESRERAAAIRALVLDVDGTLTDGGMYYGAEGEALKRFDTRDAKGLEELRGRGFRVCVVTSESSPAVAARMSKLGIVDYHPGVRAKLALVEERARGWGLSLREIAYVGDDLGDLECLERCGLSFCPADAVAEVRRRVDVVCSRGGGRGAVREVCEFLLGPAA